MRIPGESRIILKNLAVEYYTVAEGYLEIKNYTKAAEYYKLAMRNKDLYLTSYYKLARCYALSKDWKNAAESYEYLLSLDPDNVMLKTSLAYITAMNGNIDDAILKYRKLLEDNPFDESILENYVALLINVGRGEDAEESFFVLKEKFPDNKQITGFAQKLSEIVDNFDASRKDFKENQNTDKTKPEDKQL
ncbi:tetratricopeptide repeat protein [Treponema sp.]|uniref:tetratricopeptide repeat protein n=1 Tax=Treponema sp. TaxID=166 RepID=UPI00388E8942